MKDDWEWDSAEEEDMLPAPAAVRGYQLSLAEMFFVTTLAAVSIGVYMFVGRVPALAAGGGLIVLAVVRFSGCRNMVFGGLIGFAASIIMAYLIIAFGGMQSTTSIGFALLYPAAGYLVGAVIAELANDDTI